MNLGLLIEATRPEAFTCSVCQTSRPSMLITLSMLAAFVVFFPSSGWKSVLKRKNLVIICIVFRFNKRTLKQFWVFCLLYLRVLCGLAMSYPLWATASGSREHYRP